MVSPELLSKPAIQSLVKDQLAGSSGIPKTIITVAKVHHQEDKEWGIITPSVLSDRLPQIGLLSLPRLKNKPRWSAEELKLSSAKAP